LPLSIGEIGLADPLSFSQPDPHTDGDCWDTLCRVGNVVLFIVHTWPDEDDAGRIVSVRKATSHERRAYENGGES
jgi:uncharacterized DUF497 family protein